MICNIEVIDRALRDLTAIYLDDSADHIDFGSVAVEEEEAVEGEEEEEGLWQSVPCKHSGGHCTTFTWPDVCHFRPDFPDFNRKNAAPLSPPPSVPARKGWDRIP